VTETERNGCDEEGDLGLCDEPEIVLCCSIPQNSRQHVIRKGNEKKRLRRTERRRKKVVRGICEIEWG